MTWTELITLDANCELDTKQVVSIFYNLSHPVAEEGLSDIALLRNHGAGNGFCIRLTWHSEIPETGQSDLGFRLAEIFSENGKTHHSVWRRETSLHVLNWKAFSRTLPQAQKHACPRRPN